MMVPKLALMRILSQLVSKGMLEVGSELSLRIRMVMRGPRGWLGSGSGEGLGMMYSSSVRSVLWRMYALAMVARGLRIDFR